MFWLNHWSAHWREIKHLVDWCHYNCSFSIKQTRELLVDFRKRISGDNATVFLGGSAGERIGSFKFLGVNISDYLYWAQHIDII